MMREAAIMARRAYSQSASAAAPYNGNRNLSRRQHFTNLMAMLVAEMPIVEIHCILRHQYLSIAF